MKPRVSAVTEEQQTQKTSVFKQLKKLPWVTSKKLLLPVISVANLPLQKRPVALWLAKSRP